MVKLTLKTTLTTIQKGIRARHAARETTFR